MKKRGIDAGGSETRCAKSAQDIVRIQSTCMEIPASAPSKGHILDNKLLDFVIKKCPCEVLVDRRFVRGEAMNQFNGDVMKCDNTSQKVLQEITYINILYALAVDCVKRGLNDEDFRIGVCIPAAEYYDDVNRRADEVKDNLAGMTAIYFPMLDQTIRFNIERKNILVTAEGVVAAMRFKTDRSFVLKNTVVVDVGYRSTDITVLQKFQPVGASAASRPIGGVNLEAYIVSQLERDNIFVQSSEVQTSLTNNYCIDKTTGDLVNITKYVQMAGGMSQDTVAKVVDLMAVDELSFDRAQVELALRSNYILQGKEVVDITKYVHDAKNVFVDVVYKAICDVVNAKMMNISDVSNVLCIGRPFSGDLADQHCMINMLCDKFKDKVNMYTVPDAGTANVVEIINVLGEDDDL